MATLVTNKKNPKKETLQKDNNANAAARANRAGSFASKVDALSDLYLPSSLFS